MILGLLLIEGPVISMGKWCSLVSVGISFSTHYFSWAAVYMACECTKVYDIPRLQKFGIDGSWIIFQCYKINIVRWRKNLVFWIWRSRGMVCGRYIGQQAKLLFFIVWFGGILIVQIQQRSEGKERLKIHIWGFMNWSGGLIWGIWRSTRMGFKVH